MAGPLPPQQTPISDGEPLAWMPDQAARAWEVTRYVERLVRGGKPLPRNSGKGDQRANLKAKATSIITAGSGSTPGSGTFVERLFNGTSKSNGELIGTCYNDHDKQVSAGAELTLSWAAEAWWVTDVFSCSNLS